MLRPLLVTLLLSLPLSARAEEALLAEYWASSGSLPPEYAWDTHVTIATDGALVLKHCRGYETEGPACKTRKAKVDAAGLAAIREATLAAGLAKHPARKSEEIMVGGGMSFAVVWLDGQKIELPSLPAPADRDRVAKVMAAVYGAIPQRLRKRFIDGN